MITLLSSLPFIKNSAVSTRKPAFGFFVRPEKAGRARGPGGATLYPLGLRRALRLRGGREGAVKAK